MQLNIPIFLTCFRVLITPLFIFISYLPFKWAPVCCVSIFTFAAITDWFDGFLARKWKQTTSFGAFLDPVADKVMVTMALILVIDHFHSWSITFPSATIIAREMTISSLREWVSKIGRNKIVVTHISKIKTTVQMLALVALLWKNEGIILEIGIIALYISALLTFLSMLKYFLLIRKIYHKTNHN